MKIISFTTFCVICGTSIIKKNKFGNDGIYLCDECNDLHDMDKALKIKEILESEKIFKEFEELLKSFYKQED